MYATNCNFTATGHAPIWACQCYVDQVSAQLSVRSVQDGVRKSSFSYRLLFARRGHSSYCVNDNAIMRNCDLIPLDMMTVTLWVAVVLLVLDTLGIAILLACRFSTSGTSIYFLEFGPLFVAVGALVALIAFLVNLQRARSADILDAATDLLEKAYQALEAKDGSSLPSGRRLAWLTSARLIATAEALGTKITEPSHGRIYAEKKEYWRSKFYELIFPSPPIGLPGTFYADKPEHMRSYTNEDREPLSERSLAFLYRFIRWPEGTEDPIGNIPNFTDEEIEKMRSFGPRELGRLLADVRRLNASHNA